MKTERATTGPCCAVVNFQKRRICGRGPERHTHRYAWRKFWWAHEYLGRLRATTDPAWRAWNGDRDA